MVGISLPLQSPTRRWRVLKLISSPKHCRFRGRSPELWNLGEWAPQSAVHLVVQRGSTPGEDLEVLPLERDREEANRAPEHALSRRQRSRPLCRSANCPYPPLCKFRVPTAVGDDHGRDQLVGRVGRRSSTVMPCEPSAPCFLVESTVGTTPKTSRRGSSKLEKARREAGPNNAAAYCAQSRMPAARR